MVVFNANYVLSQEIIDTTDFKKIEKAIISGETDLLSQFFNIKVDIILPSQSGIYSKLQAHFIIQEFFKKYPPTSFQIINETQNNGSIFTVGKMHTKNQHFRVCYLTKQTNNKILIYQFRIEK